MNKKQVVKDIKRMSRNNNIIPPCRTMCNRKKYKRTRILKEEEYA